jgi:hypothetical protein
VQLRQLSPKQIHFQSGGQFKHRFTMYKALCVCTLVVLVAGEDRLVGNAHEQGLSTHKCTTNITEGSMQLAMPGN